MTTQDSTNIQANLLARTEGLTTQNTIITHKQDLKEQKDASAEEPFSIYQRAAAQTIMQKLRKIVEDPEKNKETLSLIAEEIHQLSKTLTRQDIAADEHLPIVRQLYSSSWQVNDDKLAILASEEFETKYLSKLESTQCYAFIQMASALVHIKNEVLINRLTELSALLNKLDHTNKIGYKEGKFELIGTGKGLQKGVSPESLAAFTQLTAYVEEALKTGISFINGQPIVDLLDIYVASNAAKNILKANPTLRSRIKQLNYLYQDKVAISFYDQQRELFLDIDRDALLNPKKFNKAGSAIKAYTDNFNQLAAYVRQDILGEFEIDPVAKEEVIQAKRALKINKCALKIERWIGIMQICEKHNNYHALCAIGSAIYATEVFRLAKARGGISPEAQAYLDYYLKLIGNNYKLLREKQTAQDNTSEAVLPLVAVFFKDIIVNSETTERIATTPAYLKAVENFDNLKFQLRSESIRTENVDRDIQAVLNRQPTDNAFDEKLYEISRIIEPRGNDLADSDIQKRLMQQKNDKLISFFSRMGTLVQTLIKHQDLKAAKTIIQDTWRDIKSAFAKAKVNTQNSSLVKNRTQPLPIAIRQKQEQDTMREFLAKIVKKAEHFNPEGIELTQSNEVLLENIFGTVKEPQCLPLWLTKSTLNKDLPKIFIDMIKADARLALLLTANKQVMEILYNDQDGRHYIENYLCYDVLELRCSLAPNQLTAEVGSTFKIVYPGKAQGVLNTIITNIDFNLPQLKNSVSETNPVAAEKPSVSPSILSNS
jgi:hypothetical protein